MIIAEAKKALMDIAEGKMHSLEYQVKDFGKGSFKQECKVYLHDYSHHSAETWEAALLSLADEINGDHPITEAMPLSKPEQ